MKDSQLRDLAQQIMQLAQEHPSFPQAHRIVANCCDHLCALAGHSEANQRLAAKERTESPAKRRRYERERKARYRNKRTVKRPKR